MSNDPYGDWKGRLGKLETSVYLGFLLSMLVGVAVGACWGASFWWVAFTR